MPGAKKKKRKEENICINEQKLLLLDYHLTVAVKRWMKFYQFREDKNRAKQVTPNLPSVVSTKKTSLEIVSPVTRI